MVRSQRLRLWLRLCSGLLLAVAVIAQAGIARAGADAAGTAAVRIATSDCERLLADDKAVAPATPSELTAPSGAAPSGAAPSGAALAGAALAGAAPTGEPNSQKGAAYLPGRDVRGRPVAAPDLDPAPDLLAAVRIEIEWTGARRRGRHPHHAAQPSVVLGSIGFDGQGRLTLNGRPLSAIDRQRLGAACRAAGDRREIP